MEPEGTETYEPLEPSSTGLDGDLAAALTYLLGFVSGIVFLMVEKRSQYVRFHAYQSTFAFGGLFVTQIVVGMVPFIGTLVSLLLIPVSMILWLFLMLKAYQGERYMLPVVGDMADERARLMPGEGP